MGSTKTRTLPFRNGLEPSSLGWRPHQVRWAAGTKQGEEPRRGRRDPLHTGSSSPKTHANLTKGHPCLEMAVVRVMLALYWTPMPKTTSGGLYAVRTLDCRFAEMPLGAMILSVT